MKVLSEYTPFEGFLVSTRQPVDWFHVDEIEKDRAFKVQDIIDYLRMVGFDATHSGLFNGAMCFRENPTQKYAEIPWGHYGVIIDGAITWMTEEMFKASVAPTTRDVSAGFVTVVPTGSFQAVEVTADNLAVVYAWLREHEQDVILNPNSIWIYGEDNHVIHELWVGHWVVRDRGLRYLTASQFAQSYRKDI